LSIALISAAISGGVAFGVASYQQRNTVLQASKTQQITAIGELEKSAIPVAKDGSNWYWSHQCGKNSCPPYVAPDPVNVAIDGDQLEADASPVTDVTCFNDVVVIVYDVKNITIATSFPESLYSGLNNDLSTLFKDCGSAVTRSK
jgi:hypothetical protein